MLLGCSNSFGIHPNFNCPTNHNRTKPQNRFDVDFCRQLMFALPFFLFYFYFYHFILSRSSIGAEVKISLLKCQGWIKVEKRGILSRHFCAIFQAGRAKLTFNILTYLGHILVWAYIWHILAIT